LRAQEDMSLQMTWQIRTIQEKVWFCCK